MTSIKSNYGDVFQVHEGDSYAYFQLVTSDDQQLNSDVLAVFRGTFSQPITADAAAQLPVDFFTHTTTSAGVPLLWSKVGTAQIYVDLSEALFKDVDGDKEDMFKQPSDGPSEHWKIWRINEEPTYIGSESDIPDQAELGLVFAPNNIRNRILHGVYGIEYFGSNR